MKRRTKEEVLRAAKTMDARAIADVDRGEPYVVSKPGITRERLASMTFTEWKRLHPSSCSDDVLHALYDDRLVAFDEGGGS